jgi:nucleoside 2-deoxyribosyltransferase
MNIFFTGSVSGGRAQQPEYARILKMLEAYGTVFPQYVSDEKLSHYGETDLSAKDIYEREQATLEKSDVVVAEVTVPSLGVGHLLASAAVLGKKVIALYKSEDTLKLSAIIKGDPNIRVFTYMNDADIEAVLQSSLT